MAIKGAALDARLQHGLLHDPKLILDISGDDFRTFMRLLVWAVSLMSDGEFEPHDARMFADRDALDRLTEAGVLECDENDLHRIHPDYWDWQTSKAELDRMRAQREKDAARKRAERKEEQPMQPLQPF